MHSYDDDVRVRYRSSTPYVRRFLDAEQHRAVELRGVVHVRVPKRGDALEPDRGPQELRVQRRAQRDGAEVRGVAGAFGEVEWAPSEAPVWNPAFDVTPASLVTAWVLDTGVFDSAAIARGEHLRGWR